MKTFNHYPILTLNRIQRVAEAMIPDELRPFVVGIDVREYDDDEPLTADNCQIFLDFMPPVVAECLDGARTISTNLVGLKGELANTRIDADSIGDADYEEYDEYCDKTTVKTRKCAINFQWNRID